MTVVHEFDRRSNGFDLLRLIFAAVVAVSHGIVIHTGSQPFVGGSSLGDFALDGFFVISGFLIVRSALTLRSFPRFAWHRFLRVMPGFWACLLVTAFVVAPLAAVLTGLPAAAAFTGDPSAWRYLASNAGLLIGQYDIAGILTATPEGASFNGSLWTLVFEAFCYVLVAVAAGLGMLTRRRAWVLAGTAVLGVLTVLQEAGVPVLVNDRVLRLVFVFALGALAWIYADRVPVRGWLAAVALAVFVPSTLLFDDYRVLGAVPLAYLFVYAGIRLRLPWKPKADLSYGTYIYHWPVFVLLNVSVLGSLPTWAFVPVGLVLTVVGPAALSWWLVEKRALAAKDSAFPDRLAGAFRTPRVSRPAVVRARRSWVSV
jgi:peptidoglycan/LPS O-acetylase OafA/YrhL